MNSSKRKKEIIDVCLKVLMENGLAETGIRDFTNALKMHPSNIFYYFNSKDEIISACIDEARERIERDLFGIALQDVDDPDKLAKDLYQRAIAQRPLMKFFVTACSLPQYENAVQPSLDTLLIRYQAYVEQFAEKLCTTPEIVAPYVYIVINTMLSFMLFGKKNFVAPQLDMVYNALKEILAKRENNKISIPDTSGGDKSKVAINCNTEKEKWEIKRKI